MLDPGTEAEWFTDEIADLGSKDSAQDLPGKWIIELGELSAMGKSAVERIKGFIARSSDHYRPCYGRNSQDFPRGCIFIGSTNAAEYLPDTTGNRRWWPVTVGDIELDALRRDAPSCGPRPSPPTRRARNGGSTWTARPGPQSNRSSAPKSTLGKSWC